MSAPAQIRRENPDPHEAHNPLPSLFLVFFGVMAAFGFTYLVAHGGRDFATGGDQRSAQAVVEVTGESLFQSRCASCHQSTGAGVPKAFPPLVGSPWLLQDKETPIRIVLLGLQGKIDVGGETYAGVMPRFSDQLSDKEIAMVLTHERSSWGNAAETVSEDDVARVRKSLGARTESWNGGDELSTLRVVPAR